MPEGTPPNRTPGPREQAGGSVTYLDQALWRQLAEATAAEEFCQAWLALQSRMIGGVSGGVVLMQRPDTGAMAPVAVWPRSFQDPKRLTRVVERALREHKGAVMRTDAEVDDDGNAEGAAAPAAPEELRFQLAFPVMLEGEVRGVAALLITPRSQTQLQSAMRQLQWGVAWLQNRALTDASDPDRREQTRLALALELSALTLEEERFQSAATVAVTELATRLDCDRVSVGFLAGSQVKVQALSHSAQFGKQMNLIRSIGLAMGESIDQQNVLVYPQTDKRGLHVLHAHEQLARTHADAAICTVPFVDQAGRAFGALTFERAVELPFDDAAVEMCDSVAAMLGPILEEKRKNDRLLIGKARDSLATQLGRLVGPRYAFRKALVLVLLAAAVFFTFAKGDYRVTAKTILEGEIQRVVAAPFRGFIDDAAVRSGDIVTEGQTMCSLDVRDLRLQYSRWSSEREQYAVEHRQAMAKGERAAMNVLSKKMKQAEAQITLLDEQIARATITAPFDGLIVSGDLTQKLGSPVDAGQVLFEVAPLDSYRVMLQVDERDIGVIRDGQTGELILTAIPQNSFPFTVVKITPVSRPEEGRNYFAVEGRLDGASERLRPGMEGFGKISVEERKLIWIWTHDLFDWLRMKLWTWSP